MLQNIKNAKRNQSGFTIIEVLIVLAIAGLIMLIVFLAVPALQRNSRNTQLRNDAANVLGGVGDFVANNNGALPDDIAADATGTVTIKGPTGTSPVTAKVRGGTSAKLVAGTATSTEDIVVHTKAKCTANAVSASTVGRAYAASFKIEAGGADVDQCVES